MSKRRDNLQPSQGDLTAPAEGDLAPYVIFTQLVNDGPFIYAGWLDAADDVMALHFAREHYGQDQQCVRIWAIPRRFLAAPHLDTAPHGAGDEAPSRAGAAKTAYQVFTQTQSGDAPQSSIVVEAASARAAIETARTNLPGGADLHDVWAVPADRIAATAEGDLIWRHTDQTYRLARGYSRLVREKWEQVREASALRDYEKEELTEAF